MHEPELVDPETAWMREGNCRPTRRRCSSRPMGAGVDHARRICATCPVIEPCLEYALLNRVDHGVWGGCSERERRRIAKARRLPVISGSHGRLRSSSALGGLLLASASARSGSPVAAPSARRRRLACARSYSRPGRLLHVRLGCPPGRHVASRRCDGLVSGPDGLGEVPPGLSRRVSLLAFVLRRGLGRLRSGPLLRRRRRPR